MELEKFLSKLTKSQFRVKQISFPKRHIKLLQTTKMNFGKLLD